jgi:hypothetical protein
MHNHTSNTQNAINVALHVHFAISDSVEEPAVLQEAFEKAFLHEASHFGMHPPKDNQGGKQGVYILPVKAHGTDLHEALQNAKSWALEIASRDAPTGLSIKKVEALAAEHDW